MKKLVLLGASIRQGYDRYVKSAFDGVAEVYFPGENCRFTGDILGSMPDGKKHTPLPVYNEDFENQNFEAQRQVLGI